jgi:hypothetical protein
LFPERNIKPCLYQFLLRLSGRRWVFHAVVGDGSMTTIECSSSGDPVCDTLARSSRGLRRCVLRRGSKREKQVSAGGFASVPDLNLRQMLRIRSYNAIEAMDFEPRDAANRCTKSPYRLLWSNFGAGQGWLGTRKRNRSNDLDWVCVQLEGRRSIQLSYGRTSRVDSKSFIAGDDTILQAVSLCRRGRRSMN